MTKRDRATIRGFVAAPEPDYAVAPGETLRETLDELGMSQSELAIRTGLTPKHVNQVMQGVVSLSADVAQRLEYATGVSARLWNRLEADYQSTQTRLAQQRELAESPERDRWLAKMPVRALVTISAIPAEPSDPPARLAQLLAFFGVASIQAWEELWRRPAAAFRQSQAYDVLPGPLAAWLRLGELAARDIEAASFDAGRLRRLLPELKTLTSLPASEGVTQLLDQLRQVGVIVVIVPEVTGARAYGATRWLGAQQPLIQLSLRGKTEDVFWLTVFHELGHVLLHGKRLVFIEEDETDESATGTDPETRAAISVEEEQARRFAHDVLFGADGLTRLDQVTDAADAFDLAEHLGVAPGIVVAQLLARGRWTYAQGARYRRRLPDVDELLSPEPADDVRPRRRERSRKSDDATAEG